MPKGYQHLTLKERCQIFELKANGLTQVKIAETIGFSPSTISRELNRNKGSDGYQIWRADYYTKQRRAKANSQPYRMTLEVIRKVEESLKKQWSPEQISGRLKCEDVLISYESIYQHVWENKRLGGNLYKNLRHSGKKYNRRSSGKAGRGCIPNRVDISKRPAVVETKSRIGDWEGDTIIGKNHKGAILSYVDRKSKFTILEKLERKTAVNVVTATKRRFLEFKGKSHTITYDNGKEFSGHAEITSETGADCYFATPYHSWERGLNEHTNGLVRQYFPKKTDLTLIENDELKRVENLLNNRPRKVLGYRTPKEILLEVG